MLDFLPTILSTFNLLGTISIIFYGGRFVGKTETEISDLKERTRRQEKRCDSICLGKFE